MDSRHSRNPPPPGIRSTYSTPLNPPASTSAGPASAIANDPQGTVETLFSHPSARVTTFINNESTGRYAPESLAPSGRVERILAVGMNSANNDSTLYSAANNNNTSFVSTGSLRIYRAPGSVTFLNCGSALKPILPKSQCWAIEEDSSKFVLQIRPPQFWRIEIPVETSDQVGLAAGFREVLDRILLFDKTPCPFQRSFTVELPDSPEVKKRPWRPVPKTVDSVAEKLEKTSFYPPKQLPRSRTSTMGAFDCPRNVRSQGSSRGGSRSGSGHSTPPMTPGCSRVGEVARLTKAFDTQEEISNRLSGYRRQSSSGTTKSTRRCSRVSGMPPPLALPTHDGSKSRASVYSDSGPTSPTASTAGSDSMFSGDWHYSSPPFSGFSSPTSGPIYDDEESLCLDPLDDSPTQSSKPRSKYPPSASKSAKANGGEGSATMGTGTGSGHRRRRSSLNQAGLRRPTLGQFPPPASILSPVRRQASQSKRSSVHTLEPTNYLANLMLSVAARITTGEWRGVVFGVNEAGEKIPVQWDYTEGNAVDDGPDNSRKFEDDLD